MIVSPAGPPPHPESDLDSLLRALDCVLSISMAAAAALAVVWYVW